MNTPSHPSLKTWGTTDNPVDPDLVTKLSHPTMGVPSVISTDAGLSSAVAALASQSGDLAVDTERASGFRYGQDAYLIQLRRGHGPTYLIDPRSLSDLSLLSDALQDCTWILHAADQDLPCMRAVGLAAPRLFDTELAARLLSRSRVGLGHVIKETLGWSLAKEHQQADWSTRPLPSTWLAYAALDVELLEELRDALTVELEQAGKLKWAEQEFEHVRTAPPKPVDPEPWRKVPGFSSVRTDRGREIVKQLWTVREEIAQELDVIPRVVVAHEGLIMAAQQQPSSRKQLDRIRYFHTRTARPYLQQWWQALDRAMKTPPTSLPTKRAVHPEGYIPKPVSWHRHHEDRFERLTVVKSVVQEIAKEINVPQENVLAPATQRELAWRYHAGVDVDALLIGADVRPWQRELVSRRLTDALRQHG
ncbi:HRDC domain-containing protein [Actinomyces vulturis]|uniref:HRDC domain-containing protein n=1 Tax=Actinomyces vulturis TaxID=1857645 RepID=UPI000B1895E4|nr:HRDC domain-containing protein [Actinomyces vulturis]